MAQYSADIELAERGGTPDVREFWREHCNTRKMPYGNLRETPATTALCGVVTGDRKLAWSPRLLDDNVTLLRLLLALMWIERIPQAIANEVEGEDRQGNGDAGNDRDVREVAHVRPSLGQDAAPGRVRRLDAQPEK